MRIGGKGNKTHTLIWDLYHIIFATDCNFYSKTLFFTGGKDNDTPQVRKTKYKRRENGMDRFW